MVLDEKWMTCAWCTDHETGEFPTPDSYCESQGRIAAEDNGWLDDLVQLTQDD